MNTDINHKLENGPVFSRHYHIFLSVFICVHLWLLPLFLCSCGPRSPEDTRSRGENLTRKLIREYQQIETRSDLQEHLPRLRVLYEALADLLIGAEKNLCTQELSPTEINQQLNEELRTELIRVYQIEGARELIEGAQQGALAKIALWDEQKEKRSHKIS